MKIRYPMLFQDEILEAQMSETPSQMSRSMQPVLEIVNYPMLIQPPAAECILVSATAEEKKALLDAGYTFASGA